MLDRRAAAIRRWRRIGLLLPGEVRERVFDPAFADLTRAWLTRGAGRATPFGLRVLGTWLGCVPIASARLVVRRGRLTRGGRAVVWGAAVVLVLVLVLSNLYEGYGAESAGP